MLNFNHLYYFHVTAREGSVRAAADKLGVTQPTVSEQLRNLERTLGVDLFHRSAGGLKLTAAGKDAFEHTTQMFQASDRLIEALGRNAASVVSLRVGVSAAISRTMAVDFLMPLLMMEGCRPSIRSGELSELVRALRSHDLDLVIGEAEAHEADREGVESTLIDKPQLVAIASPNVELEDSWANLAMLEYRPTSAFYWEIENFLQERGLRPTSAGELDDAFLMLEAVARGGFVAFVPWRVAAEAVRDGRVRTLGSLMSRQAGIFALHSSTDTIELARLAVQQLVDRAQALREPTDG